jgi:hypothetical protein
MSSVVVESIFLRNIEQMVNLSIFILFLKKTYEIPI